MSQKILGIDLGPSSIGIFLRNLDLGDNLVKQAEYFSVDVFKAGVGKDKSGEYSFAADRTKHRQSRRLYETRRRRLWATLELLIKQGYCPMSMESLIKWRTYDKSKGLYREYPTDDLAFDRWIKLDFNGDGQPDYSSPYQLREELIERQFDFNNVSERFKLGRALYHIAQRRGFKSSRGETIKEQEKEEESLKNSSEDIVASMKKSEEKLSSELKSYMQKHNIMTVGAAFARLERDGVRIRDSRYKPVRDLYRNEITTIFEFQNDLSIHSELYIRLMSTKKGEGTIFYKKPLRSQKGSVGYCTLEKNKKRCPVSHPEFERFRAWTKLNDIKYRHDQHGDWIELSLEQKTSIFNDLFLGRVTREFQFKEIRERIQKMIGHELVYLRNQKGTINFKDNQSIAGCPVTARLIRLLGPDWENTNILGNKQRLTNGKEHIVTYNAIDLWNVCYNADDPEEVTEFTTTRLGWNQEKAKLLLRLWSSLSQGYAMLSLKAIKNINTMLTRGLRYSDAVMLAKIPELINLSDNDLNNLINDYDQLKYSINKSKRVISITNSLIANYKALPESLKFAQREHDYILDDLDYKDILDAIIDNVGNTTWNKIDKNEQDLLINNVAQEYQSFFADTKRDFKKLPRLEDSLKDFLKKKFNLDDNRLKKLYHPSKISLYKISGCTGDRSDARLGSPIIGSIRNPVVLRALHILKRKINAMLDAGLISYDDTRLIVETTREINDANMRWAIETYQRQRENERKTIEKILREHFPGREINDADIDKATYAIEQSGNDYYQNDRRFSINVSKYKLWLEQDFQCMYTGRMIKFTDLLNDNVCDIEHTLPRSKSFDNSDSNLTVCDSYYNRSIKKNMIPTQLPNYDKDIEIDGVIYKAIKPRLEKWEEKVEKLRDMVNFWKARSRNAQDKDRKDQCVRQRHLWQMQLDYWRRKLEAFTTTEIKEGFRNSQLVDTGIITKYATLYLKSVFNNVEVQKGRNTATFRKMLGIQSLEEKKKRELHSHHAIDAAVLTMIPVPAKRERMLKLFYEIEECKHMGHDASHLENQLKQELNDCEIGKAPERIIEVINQNLLVNHRYKDQTFTPNHKRLKSNGKNVVTIDANGKKIQRWSNGDSIRGRLHKESYYGAIKLPMGDENKFDYVPLVRNGKFVYDDKKEEIFIVIRQDIKNFNKEQDFESIVDTALKKQINNIVSERIKQGMTFSEAIAHPIYMRDENGNDIKYDKNGRKLCPIRHVRCRVKAGRGFMTFDKSLSIRKQTNISNKKCCNIANRDYKNSLYAQNDSNYLFLLYEGVDKGKTKRLSKIIGLYEVSVLAKTFNSANIIDNLRNTSSYNNICIKGVNYRLKSIFKVGTRVLLLNNDNPTDIYSLQPSELSKRLYVVVKFNNTGSDHLYLKSHLNSSPGELAIDLGLVPSNINCLVEGQDFEINELGLIIFKQ